MARVHMVPFPLHYVVRAARNSKRTNVEKPTPKDEQFMAAVTEWIRAADTGEHVVCKEERDILEVLKQEKSRFFCEEVSAVLDDEHGSKAHGPGRAFFETVVKLVHDHAAGSE